MLLPNPRLPLDTMEQMFDKLKWEEARLTESWSVYDSFNFIVTAHHLWFDWTNNVGSAEQNARAAALPDDAKLFRQVLIDVPISAIKSFGVLAVYAAGGGSQPTCGRARFTFQTDFMRRLLAGSVGFTIAMVGLPAFAAKPAQARIKECNHHLEQRNSAMQARDWESMERFAVAYIKRCDTVDSPGNVSKAYWEVGTSWQMRENPDNALKYFNQCIQVFYGNTSCHTDKVSVLLSLQRKDQARQVHTMASKLVAGKLDDVDREMRRAASGDEKEALEIQRESLEINQQQLELYAKQL